MIMSNFISTECEINSMDKASENVFINQSVLKKLRSLCSLWIVDNHPSSILDESHRLQIRKGHNHVYVNLDFILFRKM